jgi:cbb3-type cytochrome oxidase subunit 3
MYRAFYESLSFAWLPQLTTLFFVSFFLGVLVRLFWRRKKSDFDSIAALPLTDEEKRP